MHTASELAASTAGVIIFLALLRVPLTPRLGLEFPLSVFLAFTIHHAAVREFLATFLRRLLLALHERRLVSFGAGMGRSLLYGVFLGCCNAFG
jgi:hypothetical protein